MSSCAKVDPAKKWYWAEPASSPDTWLPDWEVAVVLVVPEVNTFPAEVNHGEQRRLSARQIDFAFFHFDSSSATNTLSTC